jgi:hypothetical protein
MSEMIKIWIMYRGTWIKESNVFKNGNLISALQKYRVLEVPADSTNEEINLMLKVLGYD